MRVKIKNIFTAIALMLCVFATAQESKVGEYLYIYRNGKSTRQILLSKIDSLVFVDTTPEYEAIDLGLPSGVKWASFNVGAIKPEGYGGYYAWGETEEKDNYSWNNYKWCAGSKNTITKYCTDSYYGAVDGDVALDPEDDVAHIKWGGDWRMPTAEEMQELLRYCTWTWVTVNEVGGYMVTGSNGNSIFLPAAGFRNGTELYSCGNYGYYWGGTLNTYESNCANLCYFFNGYMGWNNGDRYCGQTVRPVNPKTKVCKLTVTSNGNGYASIKKKADTCATVVNGTEVTVMAKADKSYEFAGWFVADSMNSISTEPVYTFAISKNIELVAKFKTPFDANGYDYVDLGLPSGLKWATCNVGAAKPEDFGGYYAWGETEEKNIYNWESYALCGGSENTITKYCADSYYGTIDEKSILDYADDVARLQWGGSWRMPTSEEMLELSSKCVWEWTTLNDVNGYKITGPNGNCIFMPAAGCRYAAKVDAVGKYGFYLSASLYSNNANYSSLLYFSRFSYDCYNNYRYYGHTVRPVSD